jgi:hypothetical protein
MALHWRPVGPEPAQTYWLRRAVLAAAVLLVVLLLLQLFGGGDDDRLAQSPADTPASSTPEPLPTPGASASTDPSATPDPSASASASPCDDEVLSIEAAATEGSYAVGEQPKLELRVTNRGTTPCARDLGQAAVELQVVSGDDRIWSSDDCAPGGEADLTVLQPGEAETSTVTWPGTRSLPGCQGDDEPADAGTYRVTGRVGELRQDGSSFVLE